MVTLTSIVFEQDETCHFEGKHTAMAGAVSSVDTAVRSMAIESNSTNTVLVDTIAEDRPIT